VGVENFHTKLPKGTPLCQIWSNKSFGICGSDIVLTLYSGKTKKVRENCHWKIESPITLRRYRDIVIHILYYWIECYHTNIWIVISSEVVKQWHSELYVNCLDEVTAYYWAIYLQTTETVLSAPIEVMSAFKSFMMNQWPTGKLLLNVKYDLLAFDCQCLWMMFTASVCRWLQESSKLEASVNWAKEIQHGSKEGNCANFYHAKQLC